MPNLFSTTTRGGKQEVEKKHRVAEKGLLFYNEENTPRIVDLGFGKKSHSSNIVTFEMLQEMKKHFKEENENLKRNMEELESLVKSEGAKNANESIRGVVLDFRALQEDTYTLMMISSKGFFWHWFLGFLVFISQLGLGILTIYSQLQTSDSDFNDTFLQIPIRTKTEVSILQVFSIFIVVYCQEDVFNAIALLIDSRRIPLERLTRDSAVTSRYGDKVALRETSFQDDELAMKENPVKDRRSSYLLQVLLPNFFKFLQGMSVLIAS